MSDSQYSYDNEQFIIKNYNKTKTFSNFLPGLAGKRGIPLWTFYVNRAQLISGFGLQDKNHPIHLFHSANKAYETVAMDGFRTFIKHQNKVYEAFAINSNYEQKMIIEPHEVSIEEENSDLNIKIKVSYFGLPNEEFPALVRKLEITNHSKKEIKLEVVDGLAEILPAGVRTDEFKSLSNLLQSWMDVECLEDGFAFYKLRGSTGDSAEVSVVREGNFYVGFDSKGLITPIADSEIIFLNDTSKQRALGFELNPVEILKNTKQINQNKVPSAFLPLEITLDSKKSYEVYALAGHTHSLENLYKVLPRVTKMEYIKVKEREAKEVIVELQSDCDMKSNYPEFDAYIKQNYLDNLLRGGYPIQIGKQIYHLYARKHGDLERDYNFFSLAPEYYSTGPGNFRDVCQNRRLDSLIHREVEWFNVYQFASLIQLDGYNPLSVNGVSYRIDGDELNRLIDLHFGSNKDRLVEFFNKNYSPGDLVNFVERNSIEVLSKESEYLADFINHSSFKIEAHFGEGYWIDHFSYFLDLIESYLAVYPDKFEELYFDKEIFMYYKSPIRILKQEEKSVLIDKGVVRQYKSLEHLDHKGDFAKIGNEYYRSNLFVKLFVLGLNKFALLDPEGFGVEMEAGKPGWNDAMNGLPGLFGSGVSEAIELKRILDFMLKFQCVGEVNLPLEIFDLYKALNESFEYEDRVIAREKYRDEIFAGLGKKHKAVDYQNIFNSIEKMSKYLNDKLNALYDEFDGLIPTYLTYDVVEYQELPDTSKSHNGYKSVKPMKFKRNAISPFLEAPARLLKIDFDKEKLIKLEKKVKESELFDKELLQYKTSVPLDHESYEIGRVIAFTPGWLERESNFLHMTYKYLLGLLKAGLKEEFFRELKTNLVCFMNPDVYGRSILENSSFIATSNNPNPKIHGQGFFARLSGSTVEALNIWLLMMLGKNAFKYVQSQLIFKPEPIIEKSFFDKSGNISFNFMKNTVITYHNPEKVNFFGEQVFKKYELIDSNQQRFTVLGDKISGNVAKSIRNGNFKEIHIYI